MKIVRWLLDRLLGPPVRPEDAYPDEPPGVVEPVKANITYYPDENVRPHRKKRDPS